ncbi:hypothetical protein BRD00_01395 [Halobacteriales archaeon QS_8_69_26]|nr:MAG: hypothetical protein BRD00_01395 [Halobacteriales archaeon QS_8_69_26]
MPGVRRKPVPPVPDSLDRVAEVRGAVPLVPGSVEDCCSRLVGRAGVPSRDEARTWLTFLSALGLVAESDRGFARTREPADPDSETLARAFREGVYGAREVLELLVAADEPLDADAVFEEFREHVPNWERMRDDAWERTWRERVARLLGWAALLGLVREAEGSYRT